jgi:hypothetical protein
MPDSTVFVELREDSGATTTSLPRTYLARAVEVLLDDDRVAATWMKGSLANGSAGLYSDVDLGVVVYDDAYVEFYEDREKILSSIGPLVAMGEASVGSRITVALYSDPLELDLTIDPLSAVRRYGREIGQIIFDRTGGLLNMAQAEARYAKTVNPNRAHEIVTAFWLRAPRMRRWVAQADLHRAGRELQHARDWLVELMLIANQPDKDHTFRKDTFILLTPRQWDELKSVYVLKDFSPKAVAQGMIRLAYAISKWGRAACTRQGAEYPVELEQVAASAVMVFYQTVFGPYREHNNGKDTSE